MRLRRRVWEPDYERGRANIVSVTKLLYTLIRWLISWPELETLPKSHLPRATSLITVVYYCTPKSPQTSTFLMKSTKVQTLGAVTLLVTAAYTDDANIVGLSAIV